MQRPTDIGYASISRMFIDRTHLIVGEISNIFLVEYENGLIIVDAGNKGDHLKVTDYAHRKGLDITKAKYIVITHAHGDHLGSLKDLKEITNAKIAAHREEIPYIEKYYTEREKTTPLEVDVILEEGSTIGPLEVIHTPGHTPGSICLLDPRTKTLFVGDLVHEMKGELFEIPTRYSRDPNKNRIAIASLLYYGFNTLVPSHGEPILGTGKEALLKLVKRFLKE
ncbi:MAG: MBL fold metallo-hydrolase [Desulfurococcaceae archaeon]